MNQGWLQPSGTKVPRRGSSTRAHDGVTPGGRGPDAGGALQVDFYWSWQTQVLMSDDCGAHEDPTLGQPLISPDLKSLPWREVSLNWEHHTTLPYSRQIFDSARKLLPWLPKECWRVCYFLGRCWLMRGRLGWSKEIMTYGSDKAE